MQVIAPTDADAILIVTFLLKKNRCIDLDRKWDDNGVATLESYIGVDCASDEIPDLCAGFATAGANFSLLEDGA